MSDHKKIIYDVTFKISKNDGLSKIDAKITTAKSRHLFSAHKFDDLKLN